MNESVVHLGQVLHTMADLLSNMNAQLIGLLALHIIELTILAAIAYRQRN